MTTTKSQRAASLIVGLNDSKLVANEQDWLDHSIGLTQRLASAGFTKQADQMRRTHTLREHQIACANIASALYALTYHRVQRCDEYSTTRRGVCDRPLDDHGNCDRAADHGDHYEE